MKVFISWSGDRGKQIGEAFRTWLPDVIQSIEPFYSPDIEKGQRWSSEIEQNLKESKVGIICVTPENMISPWLMFESGAISNAKLSRVFPLLFQVQPAQLQGPLSQFQATPYSEEEVKKLVFSINDLSDTQLSQTQLTRTFDRCWPELDKSINAGLSSSIETEKPKKRSQDEIIEEILSRVRIISNQKPDEESINHWIVLFRVFMDFGCKIENIGQSKSENKDKILEMLQTTQNHLRITLNLVQPKISKTSKYKEFAAEANMLMNKLETTISFMDIPF